MNINLPSNRTFGVELEGFGLSRYMIVDRLRAEGIHNVVTAFYSDHGQLDCWKIKTDASIRGEMGFEVVSPILQGQSGLEQLEKVMNVLDDMGAKVNKSTGVHVHWGVSDWTIKQFRNLYARQAKYESAINSFFPTSRWHNLYCNSFNQQYDLAPITKDKTATKWSSWNEAKTLEELDRCIGKTRYHKINMQSYWAWGTVEFRQHSGSFNFEKVGRWVELTGAMVAQVDNGLRVKNWRKTEPAIKNQLNTMLTNMVDNKLISKDTATFFKQRAKMFNHNNYFG